MDEFVDVTLRYGANVCISGLTASGKTTHAHLLAGEFGLTYISGSQIQLNFMCVSPIQSREFWITDAAKAFWNEEQFNRIDSELLKLEQIRHGCIFDTSTMPWRHRREALCIWLGSDLPSRALKSIVSHHGNGDVPHSVYPTLIEEKDRSTVDLYKSLYNIDIGVDLTPFDLILDLSSLIERPTLEASLKSIHAAHQIIRPAVAFYLTGIPHFWEEFSVAREALAPIVKTDRVLVARQRQASSP